ncbi:MAG: putative endonuclease [Methylobacteriaceae bacterium]|nr:putative endonuclease [Methylobacteriaceae bacterium]
MSRERRLRAGLFGRRAESLAILFLRARGYRILARTYVVRGGEIDIIARRGSAVAFVEVKARPTLEDALIAVTPAKQRRMSIAARHWLGTNQWAMRCSQRGDLIAIAPWRLPRHLIGAVELRLD